jgi:hypothetical protein
MIHPRLRAAVLFTLLASIIGCSTTTPSSNPSPIAAAPTTQPALLIAPNSFDPSLTLPYLASDSLEGRGVGTHGIDLAADYLAGRFRAAGLQPLPGLPDFTQPFEYTAAATPASTCSLTVANHTLKLNADFLPLTQSGEGNFDGLVAFAGYGITSESHHYDDYAGLDVRGRVVLAMRFEPMTPDHKSRFAPPGVDWSEAATIQSKAKNAAAHGAAALILFTPTGLDSADSLIPFGHAPQSTPGDIPAYHVKKSVADLILGPGSTIVFDDNGKPTARSNQVVSAAGAVRVERTVLHVKNIVGCVPGVGPHADEFVIVGAHYDHLGRGKYGGMLGPAGSIFHGADDNASGTATVLELAQHAAANPPRDRTIVFCLFTAEEEGLIGSAWFANHPPIDLTRTVAMFNMDMVGRVKNDTIYVGGGGTAKDLDAIVQAADVGEKLTVKPLPASVGGRGGMGPSDHMEFALKRIPIVFLYSGMHPDYHRPTDTADKINYTGISEVVSFGDRLIDQLSRMPHEQYDATADIRGVSGMTSTPGGDHLSGASLGVIPDYTTDTSEPGVLIQGIRPGSAADAAGLQGGDFILTFGDKTLTGLQDLADCLAMAKPGDKVALIVQRGKTKLTLHATLEKKG